MNGDPNGDVDQAKPPAPFAPPPHQSTVSAAPPQAPVAQPIATQAPASSPAAVQPVGPSRPPQPIALQSQPTPPPAPAPQPAVQQAQQQTVAATPPRPAPQPAASPTTTQASAPKPHAGPAHHAAAAQHPKDADLIEWESTANIQSWTPQQSLAMTAGAIVLTIGVYFLTRRDLFSTIAVAISAGLLIYVGQRRPQSVRYRADSMGITVGTKFYRYDSFRSFAIEQPTGPRSNGMVQLMPLRRFMPLLTITYGNDVEFPLYDLFEKHLPLDHHHKDAVDSLLGKLKIG